MEHPGRSIKTGEADPHIVRALKLALNAALVPAGRAPIRLDPDNPRFGPETRRAVQLFQARHVDAQGQPLKVDGEVGPVTWAALFGAGSVATAARASDPFLAEVLKVAAGQVGVVENPRNSNRGAEVETYLARTHTPPGHAWCCAFVFWCFDEASQAQGRPNPMVRTAGCLQHWNQAAGRGARRLPADAAVRQPSQVQPGMVFVMDFGRGAGHTGLVESVDGGHLHTVEGNTDASKTREGGGVYRLTRKIASVNKGFIDYAGI